MIQNYYQAKEKIMNGVELIAAERTRQIEQEGWTPDHDDQHNDSSLALAALCYARPPETLRMITKLEREDISNGRGDYPVWGEQPYQVPADWPESWDAIWWSPGDDGGPNRIRDLVKAGALIAAEIDRLIRLND